MLNISTLGHLSLYSALGLALLQCLVPLHGYLRKNIYSLTLARPLTIIQSLLVANAFLLLIIAFITNDFSLAYVAQNSHPALPFFYRLTAVWGAHEGSFLLWIFLLNVWSITICLTSKHWDKNLRAMTLAILGLMSFCFLLFLNCTSNPFALGTDTIPRDLNPLLQDPGFFIHPPMLYAGYVGFSATFAITMAWLISTPGKGSYWAAIVRPWVVAAWSFLTVGITLGSWWAYHVLGWGGFWFWDPVENASLLPWLAGAALLHLIIVVEKQQRFTGWAVILAILTFSLSILGTFLVRSGVLISVHSFATDPSRGLFLLILLAVITGLALVVYGWQSEKILPSPPYAKGETSIPSRENMLLLQSFLLFTAMATILLGTLYPLIMQATGLATLSVGPPYFNHVMYPLVVLCLLVMGLAPLSQWNKPIPQCRKHTMRYGSLSATLAILLSLFFTQQWNTWVICNLTLVFWVILSVINFRQVAMAFAHIGFAIMIMSIILSATFSKEREVRISTGESVALGPYIIKFIDVHGVDGPNYRGVQSDFALIHHNKLITHLQPEKRIYKVRDMVMTKVAIYPGVFHDLYIALGEPSSTENWSVRMYYKPFIRWVWLGGFCIALGGFLSLLQYARKKI